MLNLSACVIRVIFSFFFFLTRPSYEGFRAVERSAEVQRMAVVAFLFYALVHSLRPLRPASWVADFHRPRGRCRSRVRL